MASAPAIPARTSLLPRDQQRRPILSSTPAPRRSANRVTVHPASPEVISSLISTLAAISSPADQSDGTLPSIASSPSTPEPSHPVHKALPPHDSLDDYVYDQRPTSPAQIGFGMDYTTHKKPSDLLENDSAAFEGGVLASPVGKSRPPSDLSFIALPKRISQQSNLTPDWADSAYQAVLRSKENSSIGNPSFDEKYQIGSTVITANGGRKSFKNRHSLASKTSQKHIQNMDQRQGHGNCIIDEDASNLPNTDAGVDGLNLSSSKPVLTFEGVRGQNLNPTHPHVPVRAASAQKAILTGGLETLMHVRNGSPGSIRHGRTIPTRRSSLRYSQGTSPTHGKPNSHRSADNVSPEARESSPVPYESPNEVFQDISDDAAEDEVSRRIRELREQKKKRDNPVTVDTKRASLAVPSYRSSPASLSLSSEQSSFTDMPVEVFGNLKATQGVPTMNFRRKPYIASERSNVRPSTSRINSLPSRLPQKLSPLEVPQKQRAPSRRSSTRLVRLSRPISPTEKRGRTFSRSTQIDDRPASANSIDGTLDAYLSSPRLSQKIRHPQTGRMISFSEVGDPTGSVVICCVGMGLTRYITAFYDELALTLKLRLLTPDRPGVGESEAHVDNSETPLGWPDDVLAICQHLKITKFSVLAHSAGAIYALATALRIPQSIRGRIHLLAPWIPPSQMSAIGSRQGSLPISALPYSQRILRSLPTPFLKAANSSFLSTTSASITTSLPKSPSRSKRKSLNRDAQDATDSGTPEHTTSSARRHSTVFPQMQEREFGETIYAHPAAGPEGVEQILAGKQRQTDYDTRLAHGIWELATTNANPAVDLLVCLERRQPIGFRYVDITRAVVIHHGSRDSRVPVENVKWLGKTMRRCEVRVIEGEGHGLMASAGVMSNVLMEMAKEWEDWTRIVQGKRGLDRRAANGS